MTPKKTTLVKTCNKAIDKLQARVVRAGRTPPGIFETKGLAWGQFIDRLEDTEFDPQYGIFGSSACVQILCLESPRGKVQKITGGVSALPTQPRNKYADNAQLQNWIDRYIDKGDLNTTYKVASLLDCVLAVQRAFPAEPPPSLNSVDATFIVETLTKLAVADGGWADNGTDNDRNVHATAVALFSLARAPMDEAARTAVKGAVSWLTKVPLDECNASVLALLVIGFEWLLADSTSGARLSGPNEEKLKSDLESLRKDCCSQLTRWIGRTHSDETKRAVEGLDYRPSPRKPQSQEHSTKDSYGSKYEYLMYSPYCLAAFAVSESEEMGKSAKNRRFAREVVDLFARDTSKEGKFTFALRNRVASVEMLWIARLLDSYRTSRWLQNPSGLLWEWLRLVLSIGVGVTMVVLCLIWHNELPSWLVNAVPENSHGTWKAGFDAGAMLLAALVVLLLVELGKRIKDVAQTWLSRRKAK